MVSRGRDVIGGSAARRRVGVAVAAMVAALAPAACGSGSTAISSGGGGGTTATATAAPATATPRPASVMVTLNGDAGLSGPLQAGNAHFVNCQEPSLDGETIFAFENTADAAVGALLTIRAGSITVRLGSGSGTSYTERSFHGVGVTAFSAAAGASFSSSLTEVTGAGGTPGTIGAVTSVSGSVSCGTFQPGFGTVTVAGDTPYGALGGALTSLRVTCATFAQGQQARVTGLTRAGSTAVLVAIGGGTGGSTFYVNVSTTTGSVQYTSAATSGLLSFAGGSVTYTATATQSSPPGTGTVHASGTATCGN